MLVNKVSPWSASNCNWSNQSQLKQPCCFYSDSFALYSCSVSYSFSKHTLPPLLLIGHCHDTKKDPDSHAEAFYDPLLIEISTKDEEAIENLISKQHPRWWQCIAHCIRMWRRVNFASCQVRNGTDINKFHLSLANAYMSAQVENNAIKN